MFRTTILTILTACALPLAAAPGLDKQFQSPPASAGPWVYWMWLRVDTTREAITKDLEEMHSKGIKGVILYDSGGTTMYPQGFKMVLEGKEYKRVATDEYRGAYATPIPTPPMNSWEPHSRELIRFASKEAGRLGVKLCLTVGLASTSGNISPEYGQQKLIWSETAVTGPLSFDAVLPAAKESVPGIIAPMMPRGEANLKFDVRDVAVLAAPDKDDFNPSEVVNLTAKMDATGRLRWAAPAGAWKILRFAYTPTGARNAWGLFTDDLSAEAMDKTWEVTMGPLLKEMTAAERKGLMGIEDDSWESGVTTWTKRFPAEFQRLRRYDPIPWLPVLVGKKMGSAGAMEGFKRDYYRTIADLIATNHYAHLRELARRNGLLFFSEAAGPNSPQLDTLLNSKGADVPMGEFWAPSHHRPTRARRFLARNAASASHIYGKTVMACEALTSLGPHWEESFFDLKNVADQAFADGCNLDVIHVFSQSPSVTAKPGYVYFAGTHYNRGVTWWEQTPAFNSYLARISFLLQQGLFVADALYFRGDGIGLGEPMKTRPALPAEGYDHDNINLDALLTRVSVKNGRLVLPDGMSYRILALPDDAPMPPEALTKIAALVDAGATVVGPRPRGMAGLPRTPQDRANFEALAARLWSKAIVNEKPEQVLRALQVPPDFECTGLSGAGEIDWIHRNAGGTEIYFIASRWDPSEKLTCTFRVSGKQPEIWNPVTGEIRDAVAFRQEGGRTSVPLEFDPRGSVFVVFRKPISRSGAGRAASNYPRITPRSVVSGPWEVSFDPKWGGPEIIAFESLIDWTKRPEPGIRYYSGTALYRKNFNLASMPPAGEKLLLNLGEVREIASVKLNGVDLGVVWTKPARVDISRAVRTGENRLEITVVNLWPNRLIGDEGLPLEKRLTETNMHKFGAATPLFPSGLLGPVMIETATGPKYNTVHLRPLAHARGSVGCCSSEPRTSVSGLSVWLEHLK